MDLRLLRFQPHLRVRWVVKVTDRLLNVHLDPSADPDVRRIMEDLRFRIVACDGRRPNALAGLRNAEQTHKAACLPWHCVCKLSAAREALEHLEARSAKLRAEALETLEEWGYA